MKRLAAVIAGGMTLVLTVAGTALAGDYTNGASPTTVVEGAGGGGAGGTAFTGGNVGPVVMIAIALVVVGLAALFLARRRAAQQV
jgi:hypothetical protein